MIATSHTCPGSPPSRRTHGPWCSRMISCAPTVDVDWFRACAYTSSTSSSGPSFLSRSLPHRRMDLQRVVRLSGGTRSSGILA
eukprot:8277832-Heterocapsa_arctica.AAC.1